jgi:hypothetical protein
VTPSPRNLDQNGTSSFQIGRTDESTWHSVQGPAFQL